MTSRKHHVIIIAIRFCDSVRFLHALNVTATLVLSQSHHTIDPLSTLKLWLSSEQNEELPPRWERSGEVRRSKSFWLARGVTTVSATLKISRFSYRTRRQSTLSVNVVEGGLIRQEVGFFFFFFFFSLFLFRLHCARC